MTAFPFFSRNGVLLPSEQAVIELKNIEYCYGFGAYENIAVRDGIPFFIHRHIGRLLDSAATIGVHHPFSADFIEASVRELIRSCEGDRFNLKVLLIGAKHSENAELDILASNPLFIEKKLRLHGVDVITVAGERAFPQAKTLNMLPSYLAHQRAAAAGCYDALFVAPDGCIVEGTKTNLFAVRDNAIITASDERVLPGVTRHIVLELAEKVGIHIEKRAPRMDELQTFEGMFLTSTSAKVLPIRQIDDVRFDSISPVIQSLQKAYDDCLSEWNENKKKS